MVADEAEHFVMLAFSNLPGRRSFSVHRRTALARLLGCIRAAVAARMRSSVFRVPAAAA